MLHFFCLDQAFQKGNFRAHEEQQKAVRLVGCFIADSTSPWGLLELVRKMVLVSTNIQPKQAFSDVVAEQFINQLALFKQLPKDYKEFGEKSGYSISPG